MKLIIAWEGLLSILRQKLFIVFMFARSKPKFQHWLDQELSNRKSNVVYHW